MRAVIQRVLNAAIDINGERVSFIDKGILVLIGFHTSDTDTDMDYIINKTLGVRIFDDAKGVMNLSVQDIKGEVLLVSQFTLYGDVRKGKRPSYSNAMQPEKASKLYEKFVDRCKSRCERVKSGIFGANMKVSLTNSGPVTILLDSSK